MSLDEEYPKTKTKAAKWNSDANTFMIVLLRHVSMSAAQLADEMIVDSFRCVLMVVILVVKLTLV